MTNLQQTTMILAEIATYWPRFEIVEDLTAKLYQRIFEPYEAATVEQAVRHLATSSDHGFPPSAPEICRAIREVSDAKSGARKTPGEIWERLLHYARLGISFERLCERVKVSENVKGCVAEIGWEAIRRANSEQLVFLRNSFLHSYQERKKRDDLVENVERVSSVDGLRIAVNATQFLSTK